MDEYYSIEGIKDQLARYQAALDQKKAHYEARKASTQAIINRYRMDVIAAAEFWIKFHRWELDEMVQSIEEEEED